MLPLIQGLQELHELGLHGEPLAVHLISAFPLLAQGLRLALELLDLLLPHFHLILQHLREQELHQSQSQHTLGLGLCSGHWLKSKAEWKNKLTQQRGWQRREPQGVLQIPSSCLKLMLKADLQLDGTLNLIRNSGKRKAGRKCY